MGSSPTVPVSGLVYTERGPLVVAEYGVSLEQAIRLALKELDPDFFLERQRLKDGRDIYTVQVHVGDNAPGSPFRTFFYWDDDKLQPLPLSWGIVDRAKQLMNRHWTTDLAGMKQRETERQETDDAEFRDTIDEIAEDVDRHMQPGHSAVLPRGVGLRMARDKRRARGEKC